VKEEMIGVVVNGCQSLPAENAQVNIRTVAPRVTDGIGGSQRVLLQLHYKHASLKSVPKQWP